MTNGSQTAGLFTAALRRLATGVALASALLGLAACSAYDEVFGDEPVPGVVTTGAGGQQDAVVPSLASVPDRPRASSPSQRQALQDSLRRDRSQAVYSDQPAASSSATSSPATSSPAASAPAPAIASEITQGVSRPTLPEPASGRAQSRIETQTSRAPQPQPQAQPQPQPQQAPPSAVGPSQIQQYNLPQRPNYSEMVGVVFFGYGSAGLDSRDVAVLRQIVQLQQQRGGRLRIVGHASMRTGVANPVEHNLANFNMSLQRAQTVARRLEALGAPPVIVEAMGSAQPVYYEFMPTGEAGNRRAEIFLDY